MNMGLRRVRVIQFNAKPLALTFNAAYPPRHAFEALLPAAVDIRTHDKNFQSRTAIERLKAKLDGRKHKR
jgi:hypothetical protein